MKKKEFIYEYPPIFDEPFCTSGDNAHKHCDDNEALHWRLMVMSGPHVIDPKYQLEVLDDTFHYKKFVFLDPYSAYAYSEKNSQK